MPLDLPAALSVARLFAPIARSLGRLFTRRSVLVTCGEGPPFALIKEGPDVHGHAVRLVRFQVTNRSRRESFECLAKLTAMVRADGKSFNNAFLPVALATQHQVGQERERGAFNLRGGESKIVELAWLEESSPASEIRLVYETLNYPNSVPRAHYHLTVVVYGAGKPVEAKLQLYVNGRGRLTLRGLR